MGLLAFFLVEDKASSVNFLKGSVTDKPGKFQRPQPRPYRNTCKDIDNRKEAHNSFYEFCYSYRNASTGFSFEAFLAG